jgi:PHS family inorganic phosphate transporter-like MFS transporter
MTVEKLCSPTHIVQIFSINLVMPMIGHIYYADSTPKGVVPHEYAVAINIATLGGSIIGQLGFGLAGDWLGKTATGLRCPSC